MAEFGVVAVVFFTLLIGIMEMAEAVYSYSTVCSAAREAVRYAIVHGPTSVSPATTAQIQQVAISYAPGVQILTSDVTVTFPNDPANTLQKDAVVKISHNYSLGIPGVAAVTLTLVSQAQELVSQ
jgi:Flp pilus assembly protein TadG